MLPIIGAGFVFPWHEDGWVLVILHQPPAPEIGDASLVARRADDAQCMQVYGPLNDIRRYGGVIANEDRVALQQEGEKEEFLVGFELDSVSE